MKQAAVFGRRQAGVVDAPVPHARQDWAVVKIYSAPMCTEYKAFVDGRVSSVHGHEAAGEVVEVAQPGRVDVGDRVVVMPQYPCGTCDLCLDGDYIFCEQTIDFVAFTGGEEGRATMAQFLLKPDWLLVPIPDDVSYDHASLACCGLGASFGAYQRLGSGAFDTVLVTGLGPVGLGAVVNGRYRGARVIGVESNRWRAERALALGAEVVIDPTDEDALAQIRARTGGRGVDHAIDCSGVVAAHRLCIDATRRRGKVAFVGESMAETSLTISPDMIRKGLTLIGSWHYNLADTPKIMHMIRELGPQLDTLISHRFALSEIQQAWETQVSGQCAKVILKPWGQKELATDGHA
jgi:L-iditol 2-dehydrogenase